MIRRPPRSTRTDTLLPYTTLFRSNAVRYPYVNAGQAMRPVRLASSQFYFDVHAGRKIQLHQRVDRLRRRLNNVKHSLVSPDLKLLAGLLVDLRTAVHGKFFDPRWQRNGTADQRAGSARSVDNVHSSLF